MTSSSSSSSDSKMNRVTVTTTSILPLHHHSQDGTVAPSAVSPSRMRNSNLSLQFGNAASHQESKPPSSMGSSSEEKEDASVVSRDKSGNSNKNVHDDYNDFPLVQLMMDSEARRTKALTTEGAKQMEYPKSNVGWMKSLFVLEGRALDRIIVPWTIVTLNAVVWAIVYDAMGFLDPPEGGYDLVSLRKNYIEGILELVLTTTMAFLLVFRLNRSATRFWMARGCWGIIVVRVRSMVGSILLHGSHDPHHRDQTIKWIAAFSIASMNHTRGLFGENGGIDPNTVAGVLTPEDLEDLNSSEHPPLYAADMIRFHLAGLFGPADFLTEGNPKSIGSSPHDTTARTIALSDFRTQQLLSLERQLNVMIDEEGALERIKGTPLPLVYVTHLRTWLMLFLLTLPYFWEASLGYAIIPVEFLAAFALLGLEGAAAEVEAPFSKDRTNHLDMDSFCLAIYSNILQQAKEDARRRIQTKQIKKA